MSKILDELYKQLATVQTGIEAHHAALRDDVAKLEAREQELIAERSGADAARGQEIDAELEELRRAWAAAKEHLDDADQAPDAGKPTTEP